MDHTPSAWFVMSQKSQGLPWWKVLGEMIDNSLDANAKNIVVEMVKGDRKCLVVKDDGTGCKNIRAMTRLGSHQAQDTTTLGRYGVGLKDAWASCGDTIRIETVCNGLRTTSCQSWDHLAANSWQGREPVSEPCDDATGTSISFELWPNRSFPDMNVWQKLAWVFTPALQQNKCIQYVTRSARKSAYGEEGNVLKPFQLPPFDKSVQDSFEIDGKSVDINIGIIKSGHAITNGPFWFQYGHRNIMNTSLGAGRYSTQRMGGVVKLGPQWPLLKNKDDLVDSCDLSEEIFQRIEHLLREADNLSKDYALLEMKGRLETSLNSMFFEAMRESRDTSNKQRQGTAEAKNTGRKRQNAEKVTNNPGSVRRQTKSMHGMFKLDWAENLDSEQRMASCDAADLRVLLNLSNPKVQALKDQGNDNALLGIAVATFANEITNTIHGQRMLFQHDDFGLTFGGLLARIREVNHEASV